MATWTGRCVDHEREHEQRRGTRQQRGYTSEHDAARRRLLAQLPALCPRCGLLMDRTMRLDLHHSVPLAVDPRPRPGDQLVHRGCNPRGTSPENYRR